MNGDQIGGLVRALLAGAGGFAVSKGWVDDSTASIVGGSLATAIAAAWSYWTNRPGTVIPHK